MTQSVVIQVGQCGNQIGYRFWDLALHEQTIHNSNVNTNLNSFFRYECKSNGKTNSLATDIKARALLVDMEERVISQIMKSPLQSIFDSSHLLKDVSGCGNNWAVGYHFYGQMYRQKIEELLRKEAEMADCLQCCFLVHSLGGGTGSGLGTLILEILHDELPGKQKFVVGIYPSACDDVVTSPYNALLANNQLIEFADCVFPIANKDMESVCDFIEKPNSSNKMLQASDCVLPASDITSNFMPEKPFDLMNNIVANFLLDVTCASRFPGTMNVDLNEIVMNMMPYHRLHFIASSIMPLYSSKSAVPCLRSFTELFSRQHSLFKGNMGKSTFLSCALLYRGKVQLSDMQKSIDKIRRGLKFAAWSEDGWKTGMCNIAPLDRPYSVVLLSNNTSVCQPFSVLKTRFLRMYRKKAHLHHFLQVDGMEEENFNSALNNLDCLIEEYRDIERLEPNKVETPRLNVLV